MAEFEPRRGITMFGNKGRQSSFDEMNTTYATDEMKINSKGVRTEDGSYLKTHVDPTDLVLLEGY